MSGARRTERRGDFLSGSMPGNRFARYVVRAGASAIVRRRLDARVEGLEYVPASGPALLIARHFHHLYDGCLLLSMLPRPVSLLVGLDWVGSRGARWLMERACRGAGWPVILRPDALRRRDAGAYRISELRRYLRRGIADALLVLRHGGLLAIFPEGYPAIDPHDRRRRDEQSILPFRDGFARIAALAEKQSGSAIPLIPIGLQYQRGSRWQALLRIGEAVYLHSGDPAAAVALLENRVRALSAAPSQEQRAYAEPAGS